MNEGKDPHLTILLDIQKQLGVLGSETSRQSEMLKSIDAQVQKTNGRVTKLEKDEQERVKIESEEKGEKKIKSILWGSLGGIITAVIIATINKVIKL